LKVADLGGGRGLASDLLQIACASFWKEPVAKSTMVDQTVSPRAPKDVLIKKPYGPW
jgi:hypothetical protein